MKCAAHFAAPPSHASMCCTAIIGGSASVWPQLRFEWRPCA
jgi:hypothetical protein